MFRSLRQSVVLLLLLLCTLPGYSQVAWRQDEIADVEKFNDLILTDLREGKTAFIDRGYGWPRDTAQIHETIRRYRPLISRTDLTLTSRRSTLKGSPAYGDYQYFTNEWLSSDGAQKFHINFCFQKSFGKYFINSISFGGNIPVAPSPERLREDSLNVQLLSLFKANDEAAVRKLYAEGVNVDEAMLRKYMTYAASVINTPGVQDSSSSDESEESFPSEWAYKILSTVNYWKGKKDEPLIIVVYYQVDSSQCHILQIDFRPIKDSKLPWASVPGGVYSYDPGGDDPPPDMFPPPPPPPPPPPRKP